jgi:DNA-binding response OmpR family regulator
MRVLLIEPDKILAETYRQALEQAGHSVSISHTAQSAVHFADESIPDVVVLELQLAGHSGVEFLYEFRSYPEWQHVPLILHTLVPPQALRISEQLLDQLHISAYFYKPSTSLRKLVRAVNETLQPAAA